MILKKATGNTKIREEHKREILNYIRRFGPVSRTDIFEKTNISKPTVTRVIEALMAEGMIREMGTAESSVGRRPVNIEINPAACFCVGVNISRNTLSASMVDLGMNVVNKKSLSIKGISDAIIFRDMVADTIRELIEDSKVDTGKIIGIGIGAPGIVDYKNGIIMDFATAHRLVNIHLKDFLEEKLGLKVLVDNNANTRALGEYGYGYGSGYKDIIFVICSEGIGSGIITGGNMLRGKSNVTSGLGHMTVNSGGRKCMCGGYGCIESYCSTEAIEDMAKEALRRGRKSALVEKCGPDLDALDYKMICQCAKEGDSLSLQLLEEASCVLGKGIANLVGIFNPEIIILSGTLFDASDYFYNNVIDVVKQGIFSPLSQDVIFKKRKVKDSLYEVGAATMIFKEIFRD